MAESEMTTIIAADYMYLIVLGSQKTINQLTIKLNKEATKKKINKTYMMMLIDKPCAEITDIDEFRKLVSTIDSEHLDISVEDIIMDEGIETAQCLTYAEGYKNNYMLLEVTKETDYFKLSYPILQLDEEANPDELISSWVMENNVSNIAKDLTIKPVNIVGTDHDILVFVALINNFDIDDNDS